MGGNKMPGLLAAEPGGGRKPARCDARGQPHYGPRPAHCQDLASLHILTEAKRLAMQRAQDAGDYCQFLEARRAFLLAQAAEYQAQRTA